MKAKESAQVKVVCVYVWRMGYRSDWRRWDTWWYKRWGEARKPEGSGLLQAVMNAVVVAPGSEAGQYPMRVHSESGCSSNGSRWMGRVGGWRGVSVSTTHSCFPTLPSPHTHCHPPAPYTFRPPAPQTAADSAAATQPPPPPPQPHRTNCTHLQVGQRHVEDQRAVQRHVRLALILEVLCRGGGGAEGGGGWGT